MTVTLKSSRTIATPNVSLAAAIGAGTWAGLISGVVVLAPVFTLQLSRGIGVVPEMQLAASSIIGLSAYDGAEGFVLGTLLHFLVSVVPAISYALIVRRLPELNRWAWLGGPLLGLAVFLVMGFIVLPRTAVITPPSVSPMPPVPALLIHMFGLGLPISLIIRRIGPLREGRSPRPRARDRSGASAAAWSGEVDGLRRDQPAAWRRSGGPTRTTRSTRCNVSSRPATT